MLLFYSLAAQRRGAPGEYMPRNDQTLSPVERRTLPSGLDLSRAITGLWQLADMQRHGPVGLEAAAAAMRPFVDAGFTTFDMADHYGPAEDVVGRYVTRAGSATGLTLMTKWVPRPGPMSRDTVRAAVLHALARLRLDAVDVLQFHAWSFTDPSWLDCLFWLQEVKREGWIRHIGVTNFDTVHLAMAVESGVELVSNQVCYSLLDQRPGGAMTQLCLERGIALLAYGTVAGGLLTERWLGAPAPGPDTLDTWSQMKYARFVDAVGGWPALQRVLEVVADIARRHGVSVANVASRYILDRPAVAGVIIGARLGERTHLSDNQQLFAFTLDDDDRRRIGEVLSTLRAVPGDSGDEYRRPPYLTASGDLSHHMDAIPAPYAPRSTPHGTETVSTGTVWESAASFSRGIRRGQHIWISGTTAQHGERLIGGRDPALQMHFVIDKIEGALQSLGARLEDVVRTRVYVRHLADVEEVARVHGRRFAGVMPANTLVQAGLVGDDYLVEMEAEAACAARTGE